MGRAWSHREAAGGQVELGSRTCFWGILEFAIKIVVSIILSNLKKAQIHSGITLTKVVFAMSESPKFHHITKIQISYRKKERSVGIAKHSILFFRNTEKRYPYVTTAAAQQQLSRSTAAAAAAQQKQQRRWWWQWRRRRRRRQHGKPFVAQLSQQHRGPPEGEERPYKKYGRNIITPPNV